MIDGTQSIGMVCAISAPGGPYPIPARLAYPNRTNLGTFVPIVSGDGVCVCERVGGIGGDLFAQWAIASGCADSAVSCV